MASRGMSPLFAFTRYSKMRAPLRWMRNRRVYALSASVVRESSTVVAPEPVAKENK